MVIFNVIKWQFKKNAFMIFLITVFYQYYKLGS